MIDIRFFYALCVVLMLLVPILILLLIALLRGNCRLENDEVVVKAVTGTIDGTSGTVVMSDIHLKGVVASGCPNNMCDKKCVVLRPVDRINP